MKAQIEMGGILRDNEDAVRPYLESGRIVSFFYNDAAKVGLIIMNSVDTVNETELLAIIGLLQHAHSALIEQGMRGGAK